MSVSQQSTGRESVMASSSQGGPDCDSDSMDSSSEHPGAEHLLIFPERDTAEAVADELADEGFAHVSVVREAARTEDDDEAHEWAVHVVDHRLPDTTGGGAYEGLRERFATLTTEHGGWYDEPGDPRPPVTAEDAGEEESSD